MSKRLDVIHKIKEEYVMVKHSTLSTFKDRPPIRDSRFILLLLSNTKKEKKLVLIFPIFKEQLFEIYCLYYLFSYKPNP